MEKRNLLQYVGNIEQIASIRLLEHQEERADTMKVLEVKNGVLNYQLMVDKCLDIASLQYKGVSFHFLSKAGLIGQTHYDTNKLEAQRSIMGGMLFTCGLENICAPCVVDGKDYPMHGRIRTTPAKHLCHDGYWENDDYYLVASGEMREGELFGENLLLRRKVTTSLYKQELVIEDIIENEGFREEPCMLLYHFNLGYPFLSEDLQLYLPTKEVIPRDEDAKRQMDNWNKMDKPKTGEKEAVFLHDLATDEQGNTFVIAYNHSLQMGLELHFSKEQLPYFMQWKSRATGDYVMGLEPANATVYGRSYHEKQKDVPTLQPLEQKKVRLMLRFFEGNEELEKRRKELDFLVENKRF